VEVFCEAHLRLLHTQNDGRVFPVSGSLDESMCTVYLYG
jgi:hypothetical protein